MTRLGAAARKLPQHRVLRGRKMRRFGQNQMNRGNLQYKNVQYSKISQKFYTHSYTPTQINPTYAISKSDRKF